VIGEEEVVDERKPKEKQRNLENRGRNKIIRIKSDSNHAKREKVFNPLPPKIIQQLLTNSVYIHSSEIYK